MGFLDWTVVAATLLVTLLTGVAMMKFSSRHGAESYFAGDRKLPWWAIAISNTATYQSGSGAMVMLVLVYGLAGNWLWWASWIVWMPLVAIVWAPLWRRMSIVTTAELLTLRYGGKPANVARRLYALICCFGFSVLIIGYITGFLAVTIGPIVQMDAWQILLIFGGLTIIYTMLGGLVGVIATEVLQFALMMIGTTIFLFFAISQHGGWENIIARIAEVRPEALKELPPVIVPGFESHSIPMFTVLVLFFQGLFFAGSPTAGEGATAQRFIAARSEGDAMGGQLFNCFLALTFRTLPLIGLGMVALAVLWPAGLISESNPLPAGMTPLVEPAHAWAELIKSCKLPPGFVGLLIAVEIAAFTSTLSALLNWGSSFIINDIYRTIVKDRSVNREIWVSRLTTLLLFIFAGAVAVMYVKQMVGWFMFINSAMVIFLLPLAFFRFFWWRFNVWGELAAIVLGLPLSLFIWFGLDFQNTEVHPMWHGLAILFGLSFVILTAVTLLTPPESKETLENFYKRCRPPGFWGPIRKTLGETSSSSKEVSLLLLRSLYGFLACLGLVLATNALFVQNWVRVGYGCSMTVLFSILLLVSVIRQNRTGN